MSTDDGSNQDPIEQLDDISHVCIDDNQLLAAELDNICSNILIFNEWDGNRDLLVEIVSVDRIEDNKDEQPLKETPPNLSEALNMLPKLHLRASTEQPQLHSLISDL